MMKKFKIEICTLVLLFILISVFSSCKKFSPDETYQETQAQEEQSGVDVDKKMLGVFLLLYDQRDGEEKRDVSDLIAAGFKMTAHFYDDGRGYMIPGAGIEEFTWGNGKIIKGNRTMTYTFEDDLLLVEDLEDGYKFWYKQTDQELEEYPTFSASDLP